MEGMVERWRVEVRFLNAMKDWAENEISWKAEELASVKWC